MSFFFNDELYIDGKTVTKDDITTETQSTEISNINAAVDNLYIINSSSSYIRLPQITDSNQGGVFSLALVKASDSQNTSIYLYANEDDNQKIKSSSNYDVDYTTITFSSAQIKRYKSLFYASDSVHFSITNEGSGYQVDNTITIGNLSGGSQSAECYVSFRSGIVESLTVSNGGSGYIASDTISVTTNHGTGFTAGTVTISNGVISNITINDGGSDYSSSDTISMSGGGSNFSGALVVSDGVVTSVTINNGGSGYTAPSLSVTSGSGSDLSTNVTASSGCITAIAVSATGSGYTHHDSVNVGYQGSGFQASLTLNASGGITAITVINSGSNYSSVTPSITTLSGTGFSGKIIINASGTVTGIIILDGGYRYSPQDTFTVSSSSGSNCSLTATLSGIKPVITSTTNGSGYTTAPTATVTDSSNNKTGSGLAIGTTLNKGLWLSY